METEHDQQFNCLLFSQEENYLLLPAVSVLDVLEQTGHNIVVDLQGAVLGKIQWQNRAIPLLSFDSACHGKMPKLDSYTKAAVVYSLSDSSNTKHFAFTVKGNPQKVTVSRENIQAMVVHDDEYFVKSKNVLDGDKEVYIPDLPELAHYIDRQLIS